MAFLDPKRDSTFKYVFAEHPDVLIDMLNAILPLKVPIVSLEYLPPELLPRQTQKKASIVDVRCRDNLNRHFIVEMQVAHRKNLRKRMLYNAAKIIANELYPSQDFDQVRVTYSLCFLEETMYPHKEEWFHPFRISHENFDDQLLDGMEWFFVELGKWKKLDNFSITSRRDVWLSFLSHPEKLDTMLTAEYENEYKEARKALRLIDKDKYTPEQLWAMERNADELYFAWEAMKMDIDEARKEGEATGEAKGTAKGKSAGIVEGQQLLISALNDLKQGKSINEVASLYNFEVSFLESLYNQFISK